MIGQLNELRKCFLKIQYFHIQSPTFSKIIANNVISGTNDICEILEKYLYA